MAMGQENASCNWPWSLHADQRLLVRQGNALILIHPHPDRERTLNGLPYQGRKIRAMNPFARSSVPVILFASAMKTAHL